MSGTARMAGWAGFSEDELRRMRSRRDAPEANGQRACPPEAFLSRQKPQGKKGPVQKFTKQDKVPTARPDHPPSIQKNASSAVNLPSSTQRKKTLEEKPKLPVADNQEATSESPTMRAKEDEELSKKEVELREKPRLDQLQQEQRLIEEKNKRKKALLSKAIAERSKKTRAEAVKLNRIQKELQTLDEMVSTDIGILRDRIEQACIEFSQAKRRYDRAESEYVAAKLDLYKKTQIKEQLTEHLCTIIQQNELRKAKKLEELMQQLEVETDEERMDLEIEVDQMLQLQEAEAKKQLLSSAAQQSQQLSEPDSTESPSEKESCSDCPGSLSVLKAEKNKESSVESDPGQSEQKTEPTGDTNKINAIDTVPTVQGDTTLS
ncbi:RAB6-interacting golgin [Rhinoderma darwinii]|uniref:RAB6-interacting golgin n=1 Tax=Rhinoderma darwinii TaxID=43563 RepID=UPI003F66CDC5